MKCSFGSCLQLTIHNRRRAYVDFNYLEKNLSRSYSCDEGQYRNAVASGQPGNLCDPTLPRYGTDLVQVHLADPDKIPRHAV